MPPDPETPPKPEPPSETDDGTGDAVFESLWKRVLEAWDDDKPHTAFVEHALRTERLADAAGRYRSLKKDEAKAARAQKKLDAIVAAATQLLFSMKTPAPPRRTPWQLTLIAFIVSAALLTWLAYVILLKDR